MNSQNVVTCSDETRSLRKGIIDAIGNNRGHYPADIQLSDGDFQIGFYTRQGFLYSYWFPEKDTVTFSADLFAATRTSLTEGEYSYVPISQIRNSEETQDPSVFSQAPIGWNFNGDGNVTVHEELDIVEGSVDISEIDPTRLELHFDVLLTTGERYTFTATE